MEFSSQFSSLPLKALKVATTLFTAVVLILWSVRTNFLVSAQTTTFNPAETYVTITPAFQELNLLEGEAGVQTQITLKNNTPDQAIFNLRVIEIDQVDEQGQISLTNKPLDTAQNTPPYVQLSSPQIQIPAGSEQAVVLTIVNQNDLSPGGHYLAVIATQPPQPGIVPAINLGISSFLIVRKQGGERFHLALRSPDLFKKLWHGQIPDQIDLTFENQGNIHLRPQGQVLVKDILGRAIWEGTVNENSNYVWPGSQRTLPVNLRRLRPEWPLMWYTVSIRGQSNMGDQQFNQKGSWLVASPFGLIILGFILVIAGASFYYGGYAKLWKRKKHPH